MSVNHYSHVLKLLSFNLREVPELVAVGLEGGVVLGVGVATDVSHPNIKADVSKEVGKALVGQVGQPVGA